MDFTVVTKEVKLIALQKDIRLVKMEKSEMDPKQVFYFIGYWFELKEGKGQLHPRALADLKYQNQETSHQTHLSSPAADIPDRVTYNHREASSLSTVPRETNTVALEKQLEGTRITRKGDPYPKVTSSLYEMVAGGSLCATRSTITNTKACSANLYRHIKRRVGHSLKRAHCKGTWSLPESKLHINNLGLKAVFLALKGFQDGLLLKLDTCTFLAGWMW